MGTGLFDLVVFLFFCKALDVVEGIHFWPCCSDVGISNVG